MKSFERRKKLLATAVGAALALGVALQAAAQTFTINPDAIPGSTLGIPFDATFISGVSSALLALNNVAGTETGSGFTNLTAFTNGASGLPATVSRLQLDYQLYLTFSFAASLASGIAGQPGSVYNLTLLNFAFFADPNLNTTFTAAALPATNATVGGTTSDDILLAFSAGLVSGNMGFNTLGGIFLNSISLLAICTGADTATVGGIPTPGIDPCVSGVGDAYFQEPTPFYSLAFGEFNNISQGVACNAGRSTCAITSASGGIDFAVNNVPEPASLALLGIGLVGLGFSRFRSKNS